MCIINHLAGYQAGIIHVDLDRGNMLKCQCTSRTHLFSPTQNRKRQVGKKVWKIWPKESLQRMVTWPPKMGKWPLNNGHLASKELSQGLQRMVTWPPKNGHMTFKKRSPGLQRMITWLQRMVTWPLNNSHMVSIK